MEVATGRSGVAFPAQVCEGLIRSVADAGFALVLLPPARREGVAGQRLVGNLVRSTVERGQRARLRTRRRTSSR